MLLTQRFDARPLTMLMTASRLEVTYNIGCDQILLQLSGSDLLLAQRTIRFNQSPLLNAHIAKSMSMLKNNYPQIVLTGSSNTSWQMLQ